MNIVIVGAPGSGKSWLASQLAAKLNLKHIEADKLYWKEGHEATLEELKHEVQKEFSTDGWIFEGHITKLADLVLPRTNKIIVIEEDRPLSLIRLSLREMQLILHGPGRSVAIKKLSFNWWNGRSMKKRRLHLVNTLAHERGQDLIRWKNGTDSLEQLLKSLSLV